MVDEVKTKLNQEEFDLIFDVRTKNNNRPQFQPMGLETLIPEWRATEHRGRCAESVKQLQTIPGHRILINRRERAAVVHHKMNDESPERDNLIRQALAHEENGHYTFGHWPSDKAFDLTKDDDFATFLWWCKKLVDAGHLYPVKGQIQGYEAIRNIGEVQHCVQDMGLTTKPENRGDEKFVTTVLPKRALPPEASKKEPAGAGK